MAGKIKFWLIFLLGNAIILFFNMGVLSKIWFQDQEDVLWLIGYILANFIILPRTGFIEEQNRYIQADQKTDRNPLYAGGYFRKKTGNPVYWSNLKGIFYCQLVMVILMVTVWGIVLVVYKLPLFSNNIKIIVLTLYRFLYSNITIIAMGIVFWTLFLVWLGFHIYYRHCYNEAFRYTQNAEGIWQPYSNIAKRHGWGDYRPFQNHYYVRYKNMRENLRISCPANGYQYADFYEMYNEENGTDIYIKRMENETRIFQLIFLQEYTEDAMKQLNEIFADFWKTYAGKNNRVENAAVLFLLCVEEYNRELEEGLLSVCSVDQKKGRNRVAAVLTYYGKPSLEILESYGIFRGKKKYRELRGELLRLLGMSEKNNHKSYGDREEYGSLKEINEADLDDMLNNW